MARKISITKSVGNVFEDLRLPNAEKLFAQGRLIAIYQRNGYARLVDQKRRQTEKQRYRKGDEIRLVAFSKREAQLIQRLLKKLEFKSGRPFAKANRIVVPVYGREQVARFFQMLRV